MILSDVITLTRDYIDESTPGNWTDATIVRFINMRQQMLASEINHTYQDYFEKVVHLNNDVGTIVGVSLYTLPTDFLKFKRVEVATTHEAIAPIDVNEKQTLAGYFEQDNNVGFTTDYTDSATRIDMTYVYRLTDFLPTDTTLASSIPSEFHYLLSIGAAIDCFIKDESDTSELRSLWNEGLDRLKRTLRERQMQAPRHVTRTESVETFNYRLL